MNSNRRSLAIEITLVTTLLLVVTRLLFILRDNPFIGGAILAIVAVLFLYVPIIVLWLRKRPIDFLDRGWLNFQRSLLLFVIASLVIFPIFVLAAHLWEVVVLGHRSLKFAVPGNILNKVFLQLFLIALPEEFYFRGYMQSSMDCIFARRWHLLGANLGWGWVITAGVFAFAHSIITYQWWHFSIFFPALVFGYLRARTGTITAPILFHTASNIIMDWIVRSYS